MRSKHRRLDDMDVSRTSILFLSVFLTVTLAACSGGGVASSQGSTPTVGLTTTDVAPPTVTISSPVDGSSTAISSITLTGVASDDVAATRVTWRNSTTGNSGTASGIATWTASGVPLQSGTNTLIVTAQDAVGNTRSAEITVILTTAPANSATLSWDSNTEPDIAGYRVYYGTSPGNYLQPKGSGIVVGGIGYVVSGLESGVRYYFSVTAYDTSGNESGYALEVSKDIPL